MELLSDHETLWISLIVVIFYTLKVDLFSASWPYLVNEVFSLLAGVWNFWLENELQLKSASPKGYPRGVREVLTNSVVPETRFLAPKRPFEGQWSLGYTVSGNHLKWLVTFYMCHVAYCIQWRFHNMKDWFICIFFFWKLFVCLFLNHSMCFQTWNQKVYVQVLNQVV